MFIYSAQKSARSQSAKSHRSARSSKHRKKHSTMKRHGSHIVSGHRKKAPKQKKMMKGSRSRKSLKREGSMDDMHIERLSKPTDHSKLRRRIERERRRDFERSKSQFLQRSHSRSAHRSNKDLHDNSMVKKYKTYISKFGETTTENND